LNKELEQIIEARTIELTEKNTKLMDSIDYAKKIQEAILPAPEELAEIFSEYFVIWKPRDIVGGDFYWVKNTRDGYIIVVADCTGHGVPGAFMTMAVNSILNNIVTSMETHDPATIIKEIDTLLKQHLNRSKTNRFTDDGLEAGVCYIGKDRRILFAGAGIDLYIRNHTGLSISKGINKGIGYRKTDLGKLTSQCFTWDEDQFNSGKRSG